MPASFLAEVLGQIQPIDLFDISLVAVLIYLLLSSVSQLASPAAARRLIVVALFVLAVYMVARSFDLYLFERLVQLLLAIALIGSIILFQSDIKQMLDRVATWRFLRRRKTPDTANLVDELAESVTRMADQKIGVLIALRGRDALDGHVRGGVELDGKISEPLLYSIFHPDSPGHDGAVLVHGGRIERFAAHLPLASRLPGVNRFSGTRHTAALGLAEVTDAMVVVVSEERGSISIAEGGTILEVNTAAELKERLDGFWTHHYAMEGRTRARWWRRWNPAAGIVSIAASILLWLLFVYSPYTVYRTFPVPIEFRDMPADWVLQDPVPIEARVAFTASPQAFRRMEEEELLVSIDMSNPQPEVQEIVISEDNLLNVPADVQLERVSPRVLHVEPRRLQRIRVPIRVETTGNLPDTLALNFIRTSPDSVTLVASEAFLDDVQRVNTEAINLDHVTGSTELEVNLVPPRNARLLSEENSSTRVSIDVRRRVRSRLPDD